MRMAFNLYCNGTPSVDEDAEIEEQLRAAEISAEGISIYKHEPNGKVADAYHSLTEEVLGNE